MRKRHALFVCVMCVLLAGVAAAKHRKVTLKNGREITGTVVETDDGYRITTPEGLTAVIPADRVESIEDVVTPEDEYAKRKEGKDLSDPVVRYSLGRWALNKGYLEIAQRELEAAKELRAKEGEDFEMADLLLDQVRERLAAREAEDAGEGEGPDGTTPPRRALMKMKDVNRIRQREARDDEQIRVTFKNGVRRRFVDARRGRGDFKQPGFEKEFWDMSMLDQAQYILEHTDKSAHKIRDDIVFRRDPQVMVTYQRQIWPLLRQSCAGAGCHGQREKGDGEVRFKLFDVVGDRTRAHYTNFYILSTYEDDGWKAIDRDHPDLSLVLQYGLPAKYAERKHPEEIQPLFRDREDPKYGMVRDWIDALDGPPFRGYDVEYKLPKPGEDGATTRPATRPAERE
ncbi:MAG: hypothetical protein ACOC8F_07525 [Planctomycetota bacterium]